MLKGILSVIKRYVLQLIFISTLLLGLQLPSFLQQYETRLQAHFLEAQQQLLQFQSLADLYFKGDLKALIKQHRESDVEVFRDEAKIIQVTYQRVQTLQLKINELQRPMWHRLMMLTQQIKQPIFQDTWYSYQANIVLNQQAIIIAASFAICFMLSLELCLAVIRYCFIKLLRSNSRQKNKRSSPTR